MHALPQYYMKVGGVAAFVFGEMYLGTHWMCLMVLSYSSSGCDSRTKIPALA